MNKEELKKEEVSESLKEEVKEIPKKEEVKEEPKKDEKKEKGIFKKKDDEEKKKLIAENKELKDKYLRANAEMQNMRRRMEEEKANLLKFEGEELIKQILPIIDNFERALNMKSTPEQEKFLNGFKMIYENLKATLKNYQVEEMEVLEQPFDPNTMEAVLAAEVEGKEANIVVDVLQKGYMYKGKVIRHAMVKVTK